MQVERFCSNPLCKTPNVTRLVKNGWSGKIIEHWYDDNNGGHLCEKCYNKKVRKSTMSGRRAKHEVFVHYYGENYHCQGDKYLHNECKMNNIICLQLHHPKGGGDKQRREIFGENICGVRFYMWLRRSGYPEIDLALLCANCHMIIENDIAEAKYR